MKPLGNVYDDIYLDIVMEGGVSVLRSQSC